MRLVELRPLVWLSVQVGCGFGVPCSNRLRTEPLYLCPKNFSANHMPVWAGLAYYLV